MLRTNEAARRTRVRRRVPKVALWLRLSVLILFFLSLREKISENGAFLNTAFVVLRRTVMSKLSFSTLPCMDYNADELFALCEKYGFSGAEVRTKDDGSFVHGGKLFVTDVGSSICIKRYNDLL